MAPVGVVTVSIKTRRTMGQHQDGIPSIIKAVRGNSARASYNFARGTQAGARRRVHVITGHLKETIKAERISYGRHRVIVGAYYGVYEEYGTRYRPPHPFFRPAVEEQKAKFLRDMRGVFKGNHR